MLMMRGVLSVLFTVAVAVLPTQLKGSSKCMVRVSSKNELDLFKIKQQIIERKQFEFADKFQFMHERVLCFKKELR